MQVTQIRCVALVTALALSPFATGTAAVAAAAASLTVGLPASARAAWAGRTVDARVLLAVRCAENVLALLPAGARKVVVVALETGHPPDTPTVAESHAYRALLDLLALFPALEQREIVALLTGGVATGLKVRLLRRASERRPSETA